MSWRAFYTEDRIFSSEDASWNDLPEEGVLIVVEEDQTGRRIIDGGDWYWMEEGRVHYVPSVSWEQEEPRPETGCSGCVKKGSALPDEEFYELYRKVKDREV